MEIKKIAVIGGGLMGRQIALCAEQSTAATPPSMT